MLFCSMGRGQGWRRESGSRCPCDRRQRSRRETLRRRAHRVLQAGGIEINGSRQLDAFPDAPRGQDDGILTELCSDRPHCLTHVWRDMSNNLHDQALGYLPTADTNRTLRLSGISLQASTCRFGTLERVNLAKVCRNAGGTRSTAGSPADS